MARSRQKPAVAAVAAVKAFTGAMLKAQIERAWLFGFGKGP